MNTAPQTTNLSLREALIEWCDKKRLGNVIRAERYFSESDLCSNGRVHIAGARNLFRTEYMLGDERQLAYEELDDAWNFLVLDFRKRIEKGEIHLSGVQTRPDRRETRGVIQGVWATDFVFDFQNDVITILGQSRYIAVLASEHSVVPSGSPEPRVPTLAQVTPELVATLDDETILGLLEEHARRVVENDAHMIFPGKISVVPIIRRKMRYRADNQQLEPRLTDEMAWLAKWIAERIPSFQTPTPKSLANVLRGDYAACKAQSKGTKA